MPSRPTVDGDARGGVVADLDGPRVGGIPPEIPLALKGGEVGVHGRRGGQSDRLADLPDGGRVATLPQLGGDEVQDFPALPGQLRVDHCYLLRMDLAAP